MSDPRSHRKMLGLFWGIFLLVVGCASRREMIREGGNAGAKVATSPDSTIKQRQAEAHNEPHAPAPSGLSQQAPEAARHPPPVVAKTAAPPALPSSVRVKVSAANLRETAGTQGKVVATVREGAKLMVQAEDKGWYLVETEDRKEGWISAALTSE